MPTSRGWSLLGGSVGLLVAGRVLGLPELAVPAVAALVGLALTVLWVRLRTVELDVRRRIAPHHTSVGGEAVVTVTVENRVSRSTPVVSVTDTIDGGRRIAPFLVGPVARRATTEAHYTLPATRRGRVDVGPLRVTLTDPFGLARRAFMDEQVDSLLVHPRVHPLRLVPDTALGTSGVRRPIPFSGTDGTFRSVRAYRSGDDPRSIHWKSTARTGTIMVREHERRSTQTVTVYLDTRRAVHDAASFERAVEVAASVIAALEERGRPFRLVTLHGVLLDGHRPGRSALAGDELVLVSPDDRRSPGSTHREATGWSEGDIAIVILGSGAPGRDPFTDLPVRQRASTVAVLTRPVAGTAPAGEITVDATDMDTFARSWNDALAAVPSTDIPAPAHSPREGDRRWTPQAVERR
ncbi:MAG: DUF58 domain-containing protein [Acidimicrobiia bacterium]